MSSDRFGRYDLVSDTPSAKIARTILLFILIPISLLILFLLLPILEAFSSFIKPIEPYVPVLAIFLWLIFAYIFYIFILSLISAVPFFILLFGKPYIPTSEPSDNKSFENRSKQEPQKSNSNVGSDLLMHLSINLNDAVSGCKREIKLLHTERCIACGGSKISQGERCKTCRGTGISHVDKTLSINIPAGISNGNRLRLKGYGECGDCPENDGDLFIEIKII